MVLSSFTPEGISAESIDIFLSEPLWKGSVSQYSKSLQELSVLLSEAQPFHGVIPEPTIQKAFYTAIMPHILRQGIHFDMRR